tara:strand:+ start:716 stop:1054 length:339 start_codon:yes stop_codon:yes gene_type:complete
MCTPEPGYKGQATNWIERIAEDDYAANPNEWDQERLGAFNLMSHEQWDATKERRSRQGVDSPSDMVNDKVVQKQPKKGKEDVKKRLKVKPSKKNITGNITQDADLKAGGINI